jgi:SAM-dependent methyltransferase
MGIFPVVQQMLKDEHKHRAITGDLLLIGRQTIEKSTLTDVEFFSSFCPARVKALDVSDFEGAEILHDLCKPLPAELHGIADFIFDGSCLDNIWDPAQALRSMSAMLRPGGRMFLFEHGTMIKCALSVFSPEWFFDFFAINGYADCQISLAYIPDGPKGPWVRGPWDVKEWQPFNDDGSPRWSHPKGGGNFYNLVLAEKGRNSTDSVAAVQAQYRKRHVASDSAYVDQRGPKSDVYLRAHRRYLASSRRRAAK